MEQHGLVLSSFARTSARSGATRCICDFKHWQQRNHAAWRDLSSWPSHNRLMRNSRLPAAHCQDRCHQGRTAGNLSRLEHSPASASSCLTGSTQMERVPAIQYTQEQLNWFKAVPNSRQRLFSTRPVSTRAPARVHNSYVTFTRAPEENVISRLTLPSAKDSSNLP